MLRFRESEQKLHRLRVLVLSNVRHRDHVYGEKREDGELQLLKLSKEGVVEWDVKLNPGKAVGLILEYEVKGEPHHPTTYGIRPPRCRTTHMRTHLFEMLYHGQ